MTAVWIALTVVVVIAMPAAAVLLSEKYAKARFVGGRGVVVPIVIAGCALLWLISRS